MWILWGLKKLKEFESVKIEGVKIEFENVMNVGYEVWVNNCVVDIVCIFRVVLSLDDLLVFDMMFLCWEEVMDKNSEGL